MKKQPLLISIVLAAAVLTVYSAVAQHGEGVKGMAEHFMINAGDLKWGDAPPGLPKGATVAVIHGDPSKPEMFTIRAKLPPGYTVMPHWHPMDEHVTVLEGTMNMAAGDKLDKTKAKALTPGGYAFMPKNVRHFVFVGSEGTVIQVSGTGPFGIVYVDPKDDPRTGGGG